MNQFTPEAFRFETIDATYVTSQTLLGSARRQRGDGANCFSVMTPQGDVRILNMYVEALEDAIEEKQVAWPIKIHVLRPGLGVVADPRIEDCFFRSTFCTSCCPDDLLPLPQRLHTCRRIERGEIVYHDGGSVMYRPVLTNASKIEFFAQEELGAVIGNSDAMARIKME